MEARGRFRRWFWRPPRAHGDRVLDRQVSFLELFYDLVYVAVISQAAHHLAEHISVRGFAEFAVVFALIWIAWVNGSLYVELHGREDGRTRSIVFVQMGLLALLAVFTADAVEGNGPAFAIVYATFLLVMTVLWNSVRRQDRRDRPDLLTATGRYAAGLAISVAIILVSAVVPPDARLGIWAAFALMWILGILLTGRRAGSGPTLSLAPTDSLVERFGLFTIIVLGEVIFGVVNGLSSAPGDFVAIGTGMIALSIGFGFWWIYFDLVGRRLPKNNLGSLASWMLSHLPITLSIAATGAAMVSLIEHAHDATTPVGTAWLLAVAVAIGLLALIVAERALVDAGRLESVYRPLSIALALAAATALVVGWARPAPWLFAMLIGAVLLALWFFAVTRFMRADAWGDLEA